jgi:hypothetical protein
MALIYLVEVPGSGGGGSGSGLAAAATESTEDHYQVKLTCPYDADIRRVRMGVVLPIDVNPATALFGTDTELGTGCTTEPPYTCSGADALGDNVEPSTSFAVHGKDVTNADPNTLFFSVEGKASNGYRLCTGNAEELLASIWVETIDEDEPATLSHNDLALVPDFDPDGPGPIEPDIIPFADLNGDEIEGTDWAYATTAEALPVVVTVSPAPNDTDGTLWVVKLESDTELLQVTLGFQMPFGVTHSQVQFLDCEGQLSGNATRCQPSPDCDDPLLAPSVDACVSWVEGPSSTRIMYVTLRGKLPSHEVAGSYTLLHVPDAPSPSRVMLGVLETPPSMAGILPTFTLEGASAVALQTDPVTDYYPFTLPDLILTAEELSTDVVRLQGSGALSEDTDGDLNTNDTDNCPYASNVLQVDEGGLMTTDPDGIGNQCQCGNSDPVENGAIQASDVAALQQALVAAAPSPETLELCSVSPDDLSGSDPTTCNIKDALVVQLAVEEAEGATIQPVCERSQP